MTSDILQGSPSAANKKQRNLDTLFDVIDQLTMGCGNGEYKWVIHVDGGIVEVTPTGWKIQRTKNAWTEPDGAPLEVFVRSGLVKAMQSWRAV